MKNILTTQISIITLATAFVGCGGGGTPGSADFRPLSSEKAAQMSLAELNAVLTSDSSDDLFKSTDGGKTYAEINNQKFDCSAGKGSKMVIHATRKEDGAKFLEDAVGSNTETDDITTSYDNCLTWRGTIRSGTLHRVRVSTHSISMEGGKKTFSESGLFLLDGSIQVEVMNDKGTLEVVSVTYKSLQFKSHGSGDTSDAAEKEDGNVKNESSAGTVVVNTRELSAGSVALAIMAEIEKENKEVDQATKDVLQKIETSKEQLRSVDAPAPKADEVKQEVSPATQPSAHDLSGTEITPPQSSGDDKEIKWGVITKQGNVWF